MSPFKLIIVDDFQLLIDGFSALLDGEAEVEVIGSALNGKELQQVLAEKLPDLILLDIEMPEMNGKETAKWMKEMHPEIKILILTVHQEIWHIKQLLKIGVHGYLLKDCGKAELMDAILTVANGGLYRDKRVEDILVDDLLGNKHPNAALFQLTPREKEIVCLVSEGLTSEKIASELHISPLTVLSHRKSILSKARSNLEIPNMPALVKYLTNRGMLDC